MAGVKQTEPLIVVDETGRTLVIYPYSGNPTTENNNVSNDGGTQNNRITPPFYTQPPPVVVPLIKPMAPPQKLTSTPQITVADGWESNNPYTFYVSGWTIKMTYDITGSGAANPTSNSLWTINIGSWNGTSLDRHPGYGQLYIYQKTSEFLALGLIGFTKLSFAHNNGADKPLTLYIRNSGGTEIQYFDAVTSGETVNLNAASISALKSGTARLDIQDLLSSGILFQVAYITLE